MADAACVPAGAFAGESAVVSFAAGVEAHAAPNATISSETESIRSKLTPRSIGPADRIAESGVHDEFGCANSLFLAIVDPRFAIDCLFSTRNLQNTSA